MVRLRGPLLSLKASKQLAKTLIYKTKAGRSFLTKYNYPGSKISFVASAAQETQRTLYTTIVTAWQDLSAGEKAVYNARAKGKPYSGWNLFFKEYETAPASPWLGTWAKRIKITISNDNIDSALTHFPVPLFLNASAGTGNKNITCIFDEVGANSKKIAVTKTDMLTEIYVEIEQWDSGAETAILWVSKSDLILSDSGTTDLYIYYGSAHADNDAYVGLSGIAGRNGPRENVWDSNFKAVYHLNDDDTDQSVIDSTSNDIDGTKKANAEPTQADAKIGKGQDFDGANDYISLGVDIFGFGANPFTISAWVYLNANQNANIIGNYDPGVDPAFYNLQYRAGAGNGYEFYTRDSNADANNTKAGVETRDTWLLITGIMRASSSAIWVDDTKRDDTPHAQPIDSVEAGSNNRIGYRPDNSWPWADKLDEIQITIGERTSAWIKATYHSQTDGLLSYGDEENKP